MTEKWQEERVLVKYCPGHESQPQTIKGEILVGNWCDACKQTNRIGLIAIIDAIAKAITSPNYKG